MLLRSGRNYYFNQDFTIMNELKPSEWENYYYNIYFDKKYFKGGV